MRALLALCYGVLCYALFLATFLYAIAFVGDFPVPRTLDRPPPIGPETLTPWIIDLALLGLFAVQHSGMARQGFKAWLARSLSPAIERSTYVLLSSLALILLFWQWRPLPGTVWQVEAGWGQAVLYALFAGGWLLVLAGTFVINHFDLFGLRQVWLYARGQPGNPLPFKRHFFYRVVRHPLMLGFLVAFWATPHMSTGHLLFALATSGYIVIAVKFLEERDLIAAHGGDYRRYQREVPMLCPWPRPHRKASGRAPGAAH
ncbi:MAG: methanethiol S-methyltransferase [Rhodanobacter sp.]